MPEDFTQGGAAADGGSSSFDDFLARYLEGERARSARTIDLSRFLTARTQEILQRAGRFALERGQNELDALHILRVIVSEEPAKDAVARLGVDPKVIAKAPEVRGPTVADLRDPTKQAQIPIKLKPTLSLAPSRPAVADDDDENYGRRRYR